MKEEKVKRDYLRKRRGVLCVWHCVRVCERL
jgi:hypothetical protein